MGDVAASCLCVFGMIVLLIFDVFVVLQEKKKKNKCTGRGGLGCMIATGPVNMFSTLDSAKKVLGVLQTHIFSKFTDRTDIL